MTLSPSPPLPGRRPGSRRAPRSRRPPDGPGLDSLEPDEGPGPEIASLLAKGDTAAVAARFSPQVAAALPAERFRGGLELSPAQLGALRSIGEPVVRRTRRRDRVGPGDVRENRRLAPDGLRRGGAPDRLPDPPGTAARGVDAGAVRRPGEGAREGGDGRDGRVGAPRHADAPGRGERPAPGDRPRPRLGAERPRRVRGRDEGLPATSPGGLAARGVAVLRYEKRTKNTERRWRGSPSRSRRRSSTTCSFRRGAPPTTPGVDPKRVAVLGHTRRDARAPDRHAGPRARGDRPPGGSRAGARGPRRGPDGPPRVGRRGTEGPRRGDEGGRREAPGALPRRRRRRRRRPSACRPPTGSPSGDTTPPRRRRGSAFRSSSSRAGATTR